MKMKLTLFFLSVCFVFFSSCVSNAKKSEPSDTASSAKPLASHNITIDKDGGIPIFYNMYLSVELSSLFKSIGATYNQNMLNSPDKYTHYNLSTEKAVNLGVYAVDLTYCKYFDQIEHAGKYLKTMHQLSTDLGIPEDNFLTSIKRIETNISNKDSLIKIANELYNTSEKYLKENDRESAAALVIFGGWTEALFVATNLTNKKTKDIELIERIAEQKFSLNDLISLLKKFDHEAVIKEYLTLLDDLKSSFTKFQINEKNMGDTYKQLDDISSKIAGLRKKIVS
jgi:hypothetical protein